MRVQRLVSVRLALANLQSNKPGYVEVSVVLTGLYLRSYGIWRGIVRTGTRLVEAQNGASFRKTC